MNNIHYLIIGLAFVFAVVSIIKPLTWPLAVSVLLICIELFSRVSKSLVAIMGLSCLLAGVAVAQIPPVPANTNAVADASQFLNELKSATNYTLVPYGTYFNSNHKLGGGAMLLYNFNGYVGAGLGTDWAGEWRSFSGTVNAHYTLDVTTNFSATLYGVAAAGSSVGGAGTDNGALATGEGGGFNLNYQFTPKLNAGAGLGYITRQNCGDFSGGSEMLTVTLGWKF